MGEQTLASYTCSLDDAQAVALEAHLQEHGFEMREVPHTRFAGHRDKLNVSYYTSGKLLVQGKGTREFVEFVLEPEILKEARLGYGRKLIRTLFGLAWGWMNRGRVIFLVHWWWLQFT